MLNKLFQFVPGLTALHRTPFSSLRYKKVAAERRRYAQNTNGELS